MGYYYLMKTKQSLFIGTLLVAIISLFLISSRKTKTTLDYFVYITAPGIDQLLVIDPISQSIAKKVQTYWAATGIAISPIADIAFVVHNICGTSSTVNPLYIINLQTQETITTIPISRCAYDVTISPDGSLAYVFGGGPDNMYNLEGSDIYIIDTNSYGIIKTIDIEGGTQGNFVIDSTGTIGYVLTSDNLQSEGWVSILDLNTGSVINTILVGNKPADAILSPDESKLYVTNSTDNTVSVIDTTLKKVIKTIKIDCTPTDIYEDCYVAGLDISYDGSTLYVAGIESIIVFNTDTYELIAIIPTRYGSNRLLVTPDDAFLYVASAISVITIIDTKTNSVIKEITEGIYGTMYLGIDIWIPQSQDIILLDTPPSTQETTFTPTTDVLTSTPESTPTQLEEDETEAPTP